MVRRSAVAWPVLLALALATLGTVVAIADLYEVRGVREAVVSRAGQHTSCLVRLHAWLASRACVVKDRAVLGLARVTCCAQ